MLLRLPGYTDRFYLLTFSYLLFHLPLPRRSGGVEPLELGADGDRRLLCLLGRRIRVRRGGGADEHRG